MIAPQTHRIFTISKAPIRYLVIPKCGCTFVKNVLWMVEHGQAYHSPLRIHDKDDAFLRASNLDLTAESIRCEEYAFTVIRNPVDRFFSLYSDKVIGPGHKNYVPLRKLLVDKYSLNPSPKCAEEHRTNCNILIDWLEKNLSREVDVKKEAHWTPQSYRRSLFLNFNLKILLVDELNLQLALLLREVVPNIDRLIEYAEPNKSQKMFKKSKILDVEIKRRINNVYANDRRLYNSARKAWEEIDILNSTATDIPRFQANWIKQ